MGHYSPSRLIKESLRLHGQLIRKSGAPLSPRIGNPAAYEEFVENNYRQNLRQAALALQGDIMGRSSASQRSNSYLASMHSLKQRSIRHSKLDDFEQIYANDVSALKKLKIHEDNLQRLSKGRLLIPD